MSDAKVSDPENAPFFEPHRVPLARPWFDEREPEVAAEVVRSGMLCQGDRTAAFEEAFAAKLGIDHAVAVSSGSTALLVGLQALGVGPGDEIIAPDMTFISTASAALYLGATPVLCDIELDHYNIDPDRIEELITDRTKAIVPVHYAGQAADMDAIVDLAERRGIAVLEDAAEAHLARYRGRRYVGAIGDVGIFSFTPTKPMTTGEGGMIVTASAELAERCRLIRNFGDRAKFAWHSLGFNFRTNEVAAAIGLVQLDKLDHIVEVRRRRAAAYDAAFAELDAVITPAVRGPEDSNYQLYTVRFESRALTIDRDQIIAELTARGVGSRLYYPALHRMKVLGSGRADADYANAVEFERTALSLPIFTGMTEADQDHVIAAVTEIVTTHAG